GRIPPPEGKTSSPTGDAMDLLEAAPPLDERVSEARQGCVERAHGKSKGAGVHHLESDVPEPQSGGLVRGKPYGAFREVDPDDGARLANHCSGLERNDSRAASDIEDSFALFHMRELEQTSGDRCVIRCHVRVVLVGHTAVLLNQEPGSLLGIQRCGGWSDVYMALSPTPPPRPIICAGSNPRGNGPHDSDVPTAPRVDLERLDGLSTRAAGEGPRGVRPSTVPVEGALERRELLRPHRPEHLGAPLDPPGDGTGHRGAETGTFFGPGRFRAPCRFVTRPPPTARPS